MKKKKKTKTSIIPTPKEKGGGGGKTPKQKKLPLVITSPMKLKADKSPKKSPKIEVEVVTPEVAAKLGRYGKYDHLNDIPQSELTAETRGLRRDNADFPPPECGRVKVLLEYGVHPERTFAETREWIEKTMDYYHPKIAAKVIAIDSSVTSISEISPGTGGDGGKNFPKGEIVLPDCFTFQEQDPSYKELVTEQNRQIGLLQFVLNKATIEKIRSWCEITNTRSMDGNHIVPLGAELFNRVMKRIERKAGATAP
jgi:hypothetical protein